ncbi:MAG TPA: hypothetical protein VNC59_01280 [Thermoanaerobaculia bacterium]|nr:hypothetical protein [Thermoanaerobaculia bacterium]
MRFDPIPILQVLSGLGVRFVLIGGFAGRLWGSNTVTNDLDICYARDRANLEALAEALRQLGATLRGAPKDLPFLLDALRLERGDHFTFETKFGDLDCLGTPAGSQGFQDLVDGSSEMVVGSVRVLVAALQDLIRLKRTAGRPKDLVEVEILAALRDEIERARREART